MQQKRTVKVSKAGVKAPWRDRTLLPMEERIPREEKLNPESEPGTFLRK
jgi:hypothetical protein